jgi:hypothetical protein
MPTRNLDVPQADSRAQVRWKPVTTDILRDTVEV